MLREPRPFHGLILSGGLSSRMGRDKAQLPLDGEFLLERLARRLLGLTRSVTVAAGTRERAELYREQLGGLPGSLAFVIDEYPGAGPLAGLHAGLSALPEGYVFVMACDMPQVSEVLLARLAAECCNGRESGPEWDVIHVEGQPFHALYHTKAAYSIREAMKNRDFRVMSLLRKLQTCAIKGDHLEAEEALINLNTPEDYLSYLSRSVNGEK